MHSIERNVRDIDSGDRHALEHIVGTPLNDSQRLIIQIISPDLSELAVTPVVSEGELPPWCNVYAGLSDDEIAEIEKIALTRADLTRPPE
jgi:hypothetical protein